MPTKIKTKEQKIPDESFSVVLRARCKEGLKIRTEAYASKLDRDAAWVVRKAVEDYLDRNEEKAA